MRRSSFLLCTSIPEQDWSRKEKRGHLPSPLHFVFTKQRLIKALFPKTLEVSEVEILGQSWAVLPGRPQELAVSCAAPCINRVIGSVSWFGTSLACRVASLWFYYKICYTGTFSLCISILSCIINIFLQCLVRFFVVIVRVGGNALSDYF